MRELEKRKATVHCRYAVGREGGADGSDQGAKMEDCGRCQVEWDGSERGWIGEGEVNPKGALD